jgi:hypothetical protein
LKLQRDIALKRVHSVRRVDAREAEFRVSEGHEEKFCSAGSFPTKIAAVASLATIQSDLNRGSWIDPKAGKVLLSDYASEWLEQRKDLAVRTKELYEHLLANHIFPTFGSTTLQTLTPSKIRAWHADLSERHPSTAAKAYRLLSTIMRTAVNDGLIIASSFRITGAGIERAAERPLATVAEVNALVEAMPEGLRLVVLLESFEVNGQTTDASMLSFGDSKSRRVIPILGKVWARFGQVTPGNGGTQWVAMECAKPLLTLNFQKMLGAGDENRTRVLSLGS